MGNFGYLIYKNRMKIIIGAVIALLIGTLAGYMIFSSSSSDKHGKEDEITDSGGENSGEGQIDTPITIVPEPDIDDGIRPVLEKQVVLRVSESGDIYEVILDKVNNGTYLYKNDEITDVRCFVEQQKLDEPLLSLNSDIDGVPLSSLSKPKIEGAYEVNINTSSAVVNHLLNIGGTELRKVEAQDYVEIYLKEKKGTIKRIIVTNELLLVADYAGKSLPDVSSYWHEY